MQVETFECTETASEPIETAEEAIAIIEELGMAGQQRLVSKGKDRFDERIPYSEMTAETEFVYRVMCPDVFNVEKYDKSPIPLRVLLLYKHAKSLDVFDKGFEIWDVASAADKDPVLVAAMTGDQYYKTKRFLLARWGEVLETFSVLRDAAIKKRKDFLCETLREMKARINADLARYENISTGALIDKGPLNNPYYNA